MTEKDHDRDTLQCRVKVKELQNAYHKAREANRCSGASPMSCPFYKELDAILCGDPTSTAKITVDTSLPRVPMESGPSQEEEILDEDVEGEGDPKAEDDSEIRDAYSQELFSTLEEASQSQQSGLDDAQTEDEAPRITPLPLVMCWSERAAYWSAVWDPFLQPEEAGHTVHKLLKDGTKCGQKCTALNTIASAASVNTLLRRQLTV
ncbi:hypothetical protein UY3_10068 [Chelonia mydas]|uniref:Zinc finger and SCAN domain-containing protein 29 n=1 Tax=Chelonia mydas TaxID=8469 RepID=M7B4G0_CHEMY|nr:hypothetical protein UY3_10068 [Chelonia mydas]